MLPSWVKVVCVDINPSVVTKLVDRGSAQTMGVVTDTGLFVHQLARQLVGQRSEPRQLLGSGTLQWPEACIPRLFCYLCKVLVGPRTPYLGPDTKKAARAHEAGRIAGRPDGRRNNNFIG